MNKFCNFLIQNSGFKVTKWLIHGKMTAKLSLSIRSYQIAYQTELLCKRRFLTWYLVFSRKIMTKPITWTEGSEPWSEYYTCRGYEEEVNRKGNLTKPHEAVNVKIDKNNFKLWEIHKHAYIESQRRFLTSRNSSNTKWHNMYEMSKVIFTLRKS